jgi:hypothetical protein
MGSKKQPPAAAAPPAGKGAPVAAAAVPRPPDVAPFLTKVYDMVSDPATDAVISWAAGAGASFVIWDSHAFERDLLPRHFKHNHFTSFIRQLNTYVRSPTPRAREFHVLLCEFHGTDGTRWVPRCYIAYLEHLPIKSGLPGLRVASAFAVAVVYIGRRRSHIVLPSKVLRHFCCDYISHSSIMALVPARLYIQTSDGIVGKTGWM